MKEIRVVCAVIIKEDKVFCCKRAKKKANGGLFEFPGGKIEKGETPRAALKREIKEELKTEVSNGLYLGNASAMFMNEGDEEETFISMEARLVEVIKGRLRVRRREHSESKWLKADEIDSVSWCQMDMSLLDEVKKYLKKDKFVISKKDNDEILFNEETTFANALLTLDKLKEKNPGLILKDSNNQIIREE